MIHSLLNLKIFRKLRLSLYRDTWRNIRNLSKIKSVYLIRKLIFEMHSTNVYSRGISKFLWNINKFPDYKLVLQQFFVQSLGYHKIITMMIYYSYNKNKKFIFPLPKLWQNTINNDDNLQIKINNFLSSTLFGFYILYKIIKNIFESFIFLFEIIYKFLFKSFLITNHDSYQVIFNYPVSKSHVNKTMSEFNIINWLKKNKNGKYFIFIDPKIKKIQSYDEKIVVNSLNDIFIENLKLNTFFIDFFKYFFFCISDLLQLRYGSFLIFDEFTKYLLVKNSNSQKFKFVFIWENNIRRPLWSYITKQKPEILNLSNFNEIRNNPLNKLSHDFEGYFISTWDIYNVWTAECKNFLNKRLSNKPHINVVGPIFSYDMDIKLELPRSNIIAMFGYETHKWSCGISTIAEYQNHSLSIYSKFYDDLLEIIKGKDIFLAIKRKKEFNVTLEKKYIRNIYEKLKKNPQVVYINPKISPYRLIQQTLCTISLPFTSTSVAANFLKKESIYYDPINQINKDDPSSCGIEVISNKKRLEEWVNLQINTKIK
jgi:polysaccharide biosynthesis PFTS motif protein